MIEQVTTEDLLDAAQEEEYGQFALLHRTDARKRQLALNEAAMAVVACNFAELANIQRVGGLALAWICRCTT